MAKLDWGSLTRLDPLDTDAVAAELNLDVKAKEQASLDRPLSDAADLDFIEQNVIARVREQRDKTFVEAGRTLAALDQDISAQRGKLLNELSLAEIKAKLTETKSDLNAAKRLLRLRGDEYRQQVVSLNSFRQRRNILVAPLVDKTPVDKFALLFLFVVVEATLNMVFFAEGNELGFLGGFLIAVAIAAANVALAYILGYFGWKKINSIFPANKIVGGLAFVSFLVAWPILHAWVAFYRQANIEAAALGFENVNSAATNRLFQFDVGYLEPASLALFVVGVLFGVYAAHKGFGDGHPYPGYEREYKKERTFSDRFQEAEENFRSRYLDGLFGVHEELQGQISTHPAALAGLDKALSKKRRLQKQLREYDLSLSQTINALLARYRAVNSDSRKTPPPSYFRRVSHENYFGNLAVYDEADANIDIASVQRDVAKVEESARALIAATEEQYKELELFIEEIHNGTPSQTR